MPSIHAIVTRGFGVFAGVADVPTRGFGTEADATQPPADEPETYSGGWLTVRDYDTRRRERVAEERQRLGITSIPDAAEVAIRRVADRQTSTASVDAVRRAEELVRELEEARVEWDGRYLQMLEVEIQLRRNDEIRAHLDRIEQDRRAEDAILSLLLLQ